MAKDVQGPNGDLAQRGQSLYEDSIKSRLSKGDAGKIVALDVESGDYEVDGSKLAAIARLRDRRPGAIAWLVRVGSPYVDRIGGAAVD